MVRYRFAVQDTELILAAALVTTALVIEAREFARQARNEASCARSTINRIEYRLREGEQTENLDGSE